MTRRSRGKRREEGLEGNCVMPYSNGRCPKRKREEVEGETGIGTANQREWTKTSR